MRFVIALVLLVLAAPVASATERNGEADRAKEPRAEVVESRVNEPEMRLDRIVREEVKKDESPADVQDMPRRGSFWWLVGAIVIAGVILAIVL